MPGLASTRASSVVGRRSSVAEDADPHRAALAQVAGERAGVDAADADDALRRRARRRACAALRQFDATRERVAHDVAGDPDPARLRVLVVHAGVADVRRGHDDDLAVVRRVGERLLVAGHAGGEDGLAEGLADARRRPRRGRCGRPRGPAAPVRRRCTRVMQRPPRSCADWTVAVERRSARPRRNVATTGPAACARRTGCCGCATRSAAGSTTQLRRAGSTSARLAGSPTAIGRPWPASRPMRAGRDATSGRRRRPSRAARSRPSPRRRRRARSRGRACRRRPQPTRSPCPRPACGAWSVATTSIVPSASASRSAATSLGGAQRRVDLEDAGRSVRDELVGEQQVVRRDLGGDVDAARLRPADDLDRAGGRDVADVQARADVLGEQHVAGDDRLLGDRRPAAQPEHAGQRALVHLRVLGEPRLLRVLRDDAVERLDVLERAAHQHGVVHALAVVAEHPHPGGASRPWRRARRAARRSSPTVTAPTGCDVARSPASRPRRQTCSTTPAVSATGSVLAIA